MLRRCSGWPLLTHPLKNAHAGANTNLPGNVKINVLIITDVKMVYSKNAAIYILKDNASS